MNFCKTNLTELKEAFSPHHATGKSDLCKLSGTECQKFLHELEITGSTNFLIEGTSLFQNKLIFTYIKSCGSTSEHKRSQKSNYKAK